MEYNNKFVDFEYCKTCEYKDAKEFCDICNDCLNNPVNTNSQKPINYIENKKIGKTNMKNNKSVRSRGVVYKVDENGNEISICPKCKNELVHFDYHKNIICPKYCCYCGQLLNWKVFEPVI